MRQDHASAKNHYVRLLIMVVLSFMSMYILMYAMVGRLANVYPSFNQFYMAGLMTAPMIVIEIGLMTAMYENAIIIVIGSIAAILFFAAIRQQAAIGDTQFLKSMIPHHAGAILMCNEASISDPEIGELCNGIVSGQQSEIDKMKAILARLEQR